jgi:hypothetical protein
MPVQAKGGGEGTDPTHSQQGTKRGELSPPLSGRYAPGEDSELITLGLGGSRSRSGRNGKSRPHRDSITGPSSPQCVSVPTMRF